MAGKLTQLPTSPFAVKSGLPVTAWVRSLWPATHTKRKRANIFILSGSSWFLVRQYRLIPKIVPASQDHP